MRCLCLNDYSTDKVFRIINEYGVNINSQIFLDDVMKFVKSIVSQDKQFLEYCFNRIGITYDKIFIEPVICYEVDGEILQLHQLSSGERDYLYSLCCKKVNRKFILYGTLERLSSVNLLKYHEDFDNYDCIVFALSFFVVHNSEIMDIGELLRSRVR